MKTLGIITAAIFLGLSGMAMANDSGENHQDNTNTRGPNPYMTFSTPTPYRTFNAGSEAFAMHPVAHHAVKHHVKK
jgi:hypothetical protein